LSKPHSTQRAAEVRGPTLHEDLPKGAHKDEFNGKDDISDTDAKVTLSYEFTTRFRNVCELLTILSEVRLQI